MSSEALFSHFELLTLLGEGSYAKVWKCRDTRDGREYAIKILHTHLASQENVRTRFLREADVQTKLYHPNIVKVLAVVEDQDSVGMVMELIEGKTLADAIALQKQMPFDQIQRIMEQILDAVGYAHSHQIVHRDLKPSNILMLGDGTVKVSDFGIARLLHTPGAGVRTRTGMALGTSYYMSPEQVQGRKDLDHRSDIYSLGCILYELLVGHPMFFEFEQQTDDPDFLIKSAHVSSPVSDPRPERAGIPAGVITVLSQALAKTPNDRFDECAEMRLELKRAFGAQSTGESKAPGAALPQPPSVPLPPPAMKFTEPETVFIPGGSFTMGFKRGRDGGFFEGGWDYQKPSHKVQIRSFLLAKTVVTVAQYFEAIEDGACRVPQWLAQGSEFHIRTGNNDLYRKMGQALTNPNHPIVGVSWNDALTYVKWLRENTSKPFRLPTEAEWEYAARAGTDTAYPWGNEIETGRANCYAPGCGDSFPFTSPVGSFAANPWGLYDMQGNVREWVQDLWHDTYKDAPGDERAWESGINHYRALRGGSWNDLPLNIRCACRDYGRSDRRENNIGFRLAQDYGT